MQTEAIVASDSHLGRSKGDTITRPSLMKELAARGIRMTAQRRLLVGIIQDSPRHLDVATLLEIARKQDAAIDRATVYRTIALLKEHLRKCRELAHQHHVDLRTLDRALWQWSKEHGKQKTACA